MKSTCLLLYILWIGSRGGHHHRTAHDENSNLGRDRWSARRGIFGRNGASRQLPVHQLGIPANKVGRGVAGRHSIRLDRRP